MEQWIWLSLLVFLGFIPCPFLLETIEQCIDPHIQQKNHEKNCHDYQSWNWYSFFSIVDEIYQLQNTNIFIGIEGQI